jgi:phosphoribosyl 1,2-cyclic phosphate phosphodiesterase
MASEALAREESGATLLTDEWRARLGVKLELVAHGSRVRYRDYEIVAVESAHDRAGGSLMYVVRRGDAAFFYACDTQLFTCGAWSLLGALEFPITAAAIDQTYGPGTPGGGHMCADEVAACAARLNCDRVFATHISHEGTPPHTVLEQWTRARGYFVAYDGLRITI